LFLWKKYAVILSPIVGESQLFVITYSHLQKNDG